jgi:hypothetical protein
MIYLQCTAGGNWNNGNPNHTAGSLYNFTHFVNMQKDSKYSIY